jgi:glutamine amidotransferase
MTEIVTIIDYGSGNLKSAAKAFERSARETAVDAEIHVTDDPALVRRADRIVLPGVGAFADCRAGLLAVTGMRETLEERVIGGGVPFLGICVGMQLMARRGLEKGVHEGFGWIDGEVRVIEPANKYFKVPNMGWNTLELQRPHALFDGIETGPDGLHAYFVHSYHMALNDAAALVATADYGMPVTAAVGRDNMFGTQFHPEKSQALGLALIANFLRWKP